MPVHRMLVRAIASNRGGAQEPIRNRRSTRHRAARPAGRRASSLRRNQGLTDATWRRIHHPSTACRASGSSGERHSGLLPDRRGRRALHGSQFGPNSSIHGPTRTADNRVPARRDRRRAAGQDQGRARRTGDRRPHGIREVVTSTAAPAKRRRHRLGTTTDPRLTRHRPRLATSATHRFSNTPLAACRERRPVSSALHRLHHSAHRRAAFIGWARWSRAMSRPT